MVSPKRSQWPPIFFFFISDISNSSTFSCKIFRKKSKLENFHANVLNTFLPPGHSNCALNICFPVFNLASLKTMWTKVLKMFASTGLAISNGWRLKKAIARNGKGKGNKKRSSSLLCMTVFGIELIWIRTKGEVTFYQIDTEMSEKYDITMDDYKSKWSILIEITICTHANILPQTFFGSHFIMMRMCDRLFLESLAAGRQNIFFVSR